MTGVQTCALPISGNLPEEKESPMRTAVIENQRLPVFMIDSLIEKQEFEILRNVVESF